MAKIWVKGYTKKDGTKVPGHYRNSTSGKASSLAEWDTILSKTKKDWVAKVRLRNNQKTTIYRTAWPSIKSSVKKVESVKYYKKIK